MCPAVRVQLSAACLPSTPTKIPSNIYIYISWKSLRYTSKLHGWYLYSHHCYRFSINLSLHIYIYIYIYIWYECVCSTWNWILSLGTLLYLFVNCHVRLPASCMCFSVCLMSLPMWYIQLILLTHWGRVTHICVGKLNSIGSDNGLSPERRQAILRTNAEILLIGPLGTNFSEISIEIQTFSLKKIRLKMSSAKCCSFRLGLNVLSYLTHPPTAKYTCELGQPWFR